MYIQYILHVLYMYIQNIKQFQMYCAPRCCEKAHLLRCFDYIISSLCIVHKYIGNEIHTWQHFMYYRNSVHHTWYSSMLILKYTYVCKFIYMYINNMYVFINSRYIMYVYWRGALSVVSCHLNIGQESTLENTLLY